MLYSLLRPLLFRLDPETAHRVTLKLLKTFYRPKLAAYLQKKQTQNPVEVFGKKFSNPIGLAAGFDKHAECVDALFGLGFGFVEIGGVTPFGQPGNPRPRVFRLPKAQAIINRMGFNSEGVEAVIPRLQACQVPGIVGVNLAKNKNTALAQAWQDYGMVYSKLYPWIGYATINISSPNTPGLRELQSEEHLAKLCAKMKEAQQRLEDQHQVHVPLLVKISVDLDAEQRKYVIDTLLKTKIAGVVTSNTTIHHEAVAGLPYADEVGGLSGLPLRDASTQMIADIYAQAGDDLPIIGVGGIASVEDAQAKLKAGAKLLQLYTGLVYQGPGLVKKLVKSVT